MSIWIVIAYIVAGVAIFTVWAGFTFSMADRCRTQAGWAAWLAIYVAGSLSALAAVFDALGIAPWK